MNNEPKPEFGSEEEKTGEEIARLLRVRFGDEYGFDLETCKEIGVMPLEDAFETAYGYLAQADLDPDEVLADFMEETEE